MAGRWYCIVLLLAYLSISIADEEVLNFDKWLDRYGYTREAVDYETWKANMEYVVAHNQRHASFKVSLNKFAHLVRYIPLHSVYCSLYLFIVKFI